MKEISSEDLRHKINHGEPLVLLDVREPHEHEAFNIGGINIPVTQLPFRIEEVRQLGTGDIVVYCQSGNRSGLAQRLLEAQFGITNTVNLVGGMNAWKEMAG